MLKLIKCEFLKLKRKPLVFISVFLSTLLPLAYAIFLADANTDVDATNNMMSGLFQLSAYLLLMPLLVILASNLLFEELDNDTLKNLVTIPVNRTKLVIMWVGALPCILIVVLLDKNYIVSVVITFFYTILNYLLTNNDAFLTQPFGLNAGTLLPGPLAFRWTFQFYDYGSISEELAELLERISPYFLNDIQVFGVAFAEAAVFLALIAMVYRRREI